MGSGFDMDLEWDSKFDPDNARQTFERMLSTADSKLVSAVTDTSLNIEKEARRRSRVGPTGNMRAGWEGSPAKSRGNTIVAEIQNNTHYAIHHEYGTKYMSAQPMLRPALDSETRKLERKVRMAVNEAAQEAGSL